MSGNVKNNSDVSFHTHLKELRNRLFLVAIIFIIASGVAYFFRDPLLGFLTAPLGDHKLYNITVGGQFNFIFQVMMYFGIAASFPFALVLLYGFIAPSLPKVAQKKALFIFSLSTFLFVSGAAFGYYYAIPGAMRFLLTFAGDQLTAIITGESYLSFVLAYTLGVGLLFQIPLLMIIINWITPLKPKKLLKFERYVIVVAFIVAGLITPTPDAVNQSIIAAPVIGMYQIGFIAVVASRRAEVKRSRRVLGDQTARAAKNIVESSSLATSPTTPVPVVSTKIRQPSKKQSVDGFQPSVNRASIHLSRSQVRTAHPRPSSPGRTLATPERQLVRSLDGLSYRPRQRFSS